MKHKMNLNNSKAGNSNLENQKKLTQTFYKCFVGVLMVAILISSPFVSHASLKYNMKDTCCISKKFNSDRYSKLVRITTPDHIEFMQADREIRKNMLRDISNEGKINVLPFIDSDMDMNRIFQNQFSISENNSYQSDMEIHNDFIISQLNWQFFVNESDTEIHINYLKESNILLNDAYGKNSDENIHLNFVLNNITFNSSEQIKNADNDITNALMTELNLVIE